MLRFKINSPIPLLSFAICLLWTPLSFSKNTHIAGTTTVLKPAEALQVSMVGAVDRSSDASAAKEQTIQTPANQIKPDEDSSASVILPAETEAEVAVQQQALLPEFSDAELAELRKTFLTAEEALRIGDDEHYQSLAVQLEDYPLYPYLQYRWLKNRLHEDAEIKHYLQTQSTSRYNSQLKRRWLQSLYKRQQYETFLSYYDGSSDTTLRCYHHHSQYKTGDKDAALRGAARLWSQGKSQPKVCDPLFALLKESSYFDDELLWQRFDAAIQNGKPSLAGYIKDLMVPADRKIAKQWLNLHRQPQRHISAFLDQPINDKSANKFAHAINRLSSRDIHMAIALWDKNKQRYGIDAAISNKIERRLALKLSFEKDDGAYDRLAGLSDADATSKTQRIRLALYEQNWPRVIDAIEELDETKKGSEKWQYWLARSYLETDRDIEAEEIFSALSEKRDFYGYLAADRLDRLYQLSDNPVDVSADQIEEIKHRREFRVAFEFMVLDRTNDAKLQWWHALRQLDREEIPAAAKLAQQWQWHEIAIFTIAKVKQWDDIEMRFPMSYEEDIRHNAKKQNLNPVILFGLVRRESAFNKDARSPVGASGLMQIMPATGRQIARDLKERWGGSKSLFDPVKNIEYGSYYYQKLLDQFDGNYAIALAAYNAGPSKVKQWLPDESVPADIWIETIPYRETRDYVTSVLVYSMIYQQRLQSDALTMYDLTRDIEPL